MYTLGFIQAILMSVIRHKKLSLTAEFWNSIFLYINICLCLNICLPIFVYITYITHLDIEKMKLLGLNILATSQASDNFFLQPQEYDLLG